MNSFPLTAVNSEQRTPLTYRAESQPDERRPLLSNSDEDAVKTVKTGWKPPPGFLWIEIGKNYQFKGWEWQYPDDFS
jgi:hypothetical protein